jgi:TolB protein
MAHLPFALPCVAALVVGWFTTNVVLAATPDLGLFEAQGDVGAVGKPGTLEYDAKAKTYTIGASGENMWFGTDAFHFVWKRAQGDVALAADIRFLGTGGHAHRKAALLIRQSLEPDAPYVDAVVHSDGLTSLQYRDVKGGLTRQIRANISGARQIRIEKQGDHVTISVAAEGQALRSGGGSFRIHLAEPFLIGLGVCAHDNAAFEKAVFSNVQVAEGLPSVVGERVLESTLETIAIDSGERNTVYVTRDHIEAPNWSRDGKTLIFNSGGLLYSLPVTGGAPQHIDTGFASRCNNDHGLSPDGSQIAISDQSQGNGQSIIYMLPASGGAPRRITPLSPSYWHGWSPDGQTLAYCAERNGEYDVYTIPAAGGEERRLTTTPGLDDGPDYSPDGQWIYFNSVRTGLMQIWRMKTDGSEQQQLTSDGYNDWFPHPSPDGRWVVFVSYEKDVPGHPSEKDVTLRIMPAAGGKVEVLAKLFGGQGTINVPSWSPDSTQLAFVSYRRARP